MKNLKMVVYIYTTDINIYPKWHQIYLIPTPEQFYTYSSSANSSEI